MIRWLRPAGRRLADSTLGETFAVAYSTRLPGLAAEASFWALFALPWLILGLTAGLLQVQSWMGVNAVQTFRQQILDVAGQVLTQDTIDSQIIPLIDDVQAKGSTALGLFGVAMAIWAGSRVIGTLIDAMTIVCQREGLRSFVRTRLVSLSVYVVGLIGLIAAFPLIAAGPTFLARLMPGVEGRVTSALLVVGEVVAIFVLVVSLYHWAVPHRTPWVADIPGALIAMGLWVGFSSLLRIYFRWLFREGSVYGVISAPIAIMLWLYMTNLALLFGAAFNAALAVRRGWYQPAGQVPSEIAPETQSDTPTEGSQTRSAPPSDGQDPE